MALPKMTGQSGEKTDVPLALAILEQWNPNLVYEYHAGSVHVRLWREGNTYRFKIWDDLQQWELDYSGGRGPLPVLLHRNL